ncbi:conserved hypothetical protein [Candidatus Defluviicoccus seviourii]|uniref:Protein CreA n=1 Tax=Candidatus Defluviicoccus seviourii TaxID=2565273 RepID=A0A564WFF6_9PROT|nr:conserved hypothetical protein [Candidatus Defluviicoccus seviourii]
MGVVIRLLTLLLLVAPAAAGADEIGAVSTTWKLIGPNHKIVVEAFDDPDVANVACWVSRPKTGGVSGAVGLAEDPSVASIACRQRGPIVLSDALKRQLVKETDDGGVKVFKERTSAIFKTVQVTRLFDAARNTLVYLIWSDKVIEGSPNNSLSVVVIQPWGAPPR